MKVLKTILGYFLLVLILIIALMVVIPFFIGFFVLTALNNNSSKPLNKYDLLTLEKTCITCNDYTPTINGNNDELFDYSKGFCKNINSKYSCCTPDSYCFFYNNKSIILTKS